MILSSPHSPHKRQRYDDGAIQIHHAVKLPSLEKSSRKYMYATFFNSHTNRKKIAFRLEAWGFPQMEAMICRYRKILFENLGVGKAAERR
jgi:hypothetical protein